MKKAILASVGSVLLSALSPAFAADFPAFPVKGVPPLAPPPYIEPYYNWTGFYIGINAGYGFGESDWSVPIGVSYDVDGFVVGGTLGYNIQTGAWVWGIEGDIAWSDISGTSRAAACGTSCTTDVNWLGTVRGRIGYAFDRWMPYLTAGGAFGDVDVRLRPGGSSSSVEFGWTAGAGMEWAILANWTAKAEYLYVDLGETTCSGCGAVPAPNVSFQTHLVRGGINYRF